MSSYINVIATRPGGASLFPNEARGYKYYMMNEAAQPIADLNGQQVISIIQLKWNGKMTKDEGIGRPVGRQVCPPSSA